MTKEKLEVERRELASLYKTARELEDKLQTDLDQVGQLASSIFMKMDRLSKIIYKMDKEDGFIND